MMMPSFANQEGQISIPPGFVLAITLALSLGLSLIAAGCAYRQKAGPPSAGIDTAFTNPLDMTFVYIPPGKFLMGSPSDESMRDDDEKRHKVVLTRGFYLQTTEVTQGQWRQVMGDNPSRFKDCGDDCPVEQLSWNEARTFIDKLKQRTGRTYRLPTEAEWEYACRAGTTGAFNTGDCLSVDQANYDGDFPLSGCPEGAPRQTTVPVKTFPSNSWGLYDMHGNVWEWCADWYDMYRPGKSRDPVGPSAGQDRVFRGGGWSSGARGCRSAERNWRSPDFNSSIIGFRLATDP